VAHFAEVVQSKARQGKGKEGQGEGRTLSCCPAAPPVSVARSFPAMLLSVTMGDVFLTLVEDALLIFWRRPCL